MFSWLRVIKGLVERIIRRKYIKRFQRRSELEAEMEKLEELKKWESSHSWVEQSVGVGAEKQPLGWRWIGEEEIV